MLMVVHMSTHECTYYILLFKIDKNHAKTQLPIVIYKPVEWSFIGGHLQGTKQWKDTQFDVHMESAQYFIQA